MRLRNELQFSIAVFCVHIIQGSKMDFAVYPSELKTNLTGSASMRCSVADSAAPGDDVRRVVALLVTHNDQDVASVTAVDAPQTFMAAGNLQAKGSISATSGEGTLELSWADADGLALGEYVCEASAIDERGHNVQLTASLEVTMVEPSLADVISIIKSQSREIETLKQQSSNCPDQCNDIQKLKQENALQGQMVQNMTNTIKRLNACLSKRVGFTAALKENQIHNFAAGEIVKYEKIVLNEGNSYDANTGKMTCPISGLYSLEVYVLSGDKKYACPTIYVNGREISSPHARSDELDASSTGVSLHLHQGDVVTIMEKCSPSGYFQGSGGNWGYQPNIFTGRLIHADACL